MRENPLTIEVEADRPTSGDFPGKSTGGVSVCVGGKMFEVKVCVVSRCHQRGGIGIECGQVFPGIFGYR